MRKGISPLVAAVLLIAVTLTIAGLLAYWASSFVRQQTAAFENITIGRECDFADFRVYSCSYDGVTKVSLILENIRNIELRNITAVVFYPNATLDIIPLNESLPGNIIKSYSFSGVSPDFSKIMIRTHCPVITATVGCK